jgi:protein required for attachment to host cells
MEHQKTWYVIADGGRARFVLKREAQEAYDTRRELVSPDIHSLTHDLGAERPGRVHESATVARHAAEPRVDLHRTAKLRFVDEVAAALNEASALHAFDQLILIAPARALVELKHALDAETKGKVAGQLQKDLTHVPDADLAGHLADLGGD